VGGGAPPVAAVAADIRIGGGVDPPIPVAAVTFSRENDRRGAATSVTAVAPLFPLLFPLLAKPPRRCRKERAVGQMYNYLEYCDLD